MGGKGGERGEGISAVINPLFCSKANPKRATTLVRKVVTAVGEFPPFIPPLLLPTFLRGGKEGRGKKVEGERESRPA